MRRTELSQDGQDEVTSGNYDHLFSSYKIRLYYTIRALQDFYKDKILEEKELFLFPKNLQNAIKLDKEYLRNLYNASDYTIIDQFLSKRHSKRDAIKLLELIKLKHYEVDEVKIDTFIKKINTMYDLNIKSIKQVITTEIDPYDERLVPVKKYGSE